MRTNPFIYKLLPINEANKLIAWAEANKVEYDIWDLDLEFAEPDFVDIGLKDWSVYDADRL
jgi:hypothetical protein